MSKAAVNVQVPTNYSVWTSALGVTLPTTPTAALGPGWYELGYCGDLQEGRNVNENKICDLVGQLLAIARNQEERPFTIQAMENNRVVQELRYPNSTLTASAGTAEVQTATISGTPTGGTFTLTGGYGGTATTSPIAYNATASAVQTAVQALPGLSGVSVTGSGPYTITFPAGLGDVAQLTANGALLTGGSSPSVAVATTTPGVAPIYTRSVGSGTGQVRRQFAIRVDSGTTHDMFVIGNGEATQTGTVGFTSNGASVVDFSLQPYPDSNGNFFQRLSDNPALSATYA